MKTVVVPLAPSGWVGYYKNKPARTFYKFFLPPLEMDSFEEREIELFPVYGKEAEQRVAAQQVVIGADGAPRADNYPVEAAAPLSDAEIDEIYADGMFERNDMGHLIHESTIAKHYAGLRAVFNSAQANRGEPVAIVTSLTEARMLIINGAPVGTRLYTRGTP